MTGVRLGDWILSTEKDCESASILEPEVCSDPYIDFVVEKHFPHENYSPYSNSQHNDIALLRLSEKVEKFTDYIRPICLPLDSSVRNNDLINKMMFVSGWGRTISSSHSDIKQVVGLKGFNLQQCKSKYSDTNRIVTSSQICAGGETGKDSCNGDRYKSII